MTLRRIQVSFAIDTIGTLVGAIFDTPLSFIAAWAGGIVDDIIGILIDFQTAIPFLVMAWTLLDVVPKPTLSYSFSLCVSMGGSTTLDYARWLCPLKITDT